MSNGGRTEVGRRSNGGRTEVERRSNGSRTEVEWRSTEVHAGMRIRTRIRIRIRIRIRAPSPSTFRENCCAPTKSASDASPFWAIVRDFFSFSTLHPSTKGHRDLELRRLGVILDGESDFRGFIYLFFYKK